MANFFKNKAKIILIVYLILIAAFMIYALSFMSMYCNIHVAYRVTDGDISFPYIMNVQFSSTKVSNYYAQVYFLSATSLPTGLESGSFVQKYAQTVYDYNLTLNAFNDLLIAVGIVSFAAVAFLFIFSNNSRRIYYKSNVVIGVIAPLVIIVMALIAMIQSFGVMSTFTQNETLFKTVSVVMDPAKQGETASSILLTKSGDEILEMASSVNVSGMLVAMLLSIILIGYSVFVTIFTFTKYKKTEKERKEIIERAVAAND